MSNETVTYSLESVLKEIKDSIKEVNQKMDTLQKDENEQYTLVKAISDLQGFRGLIVPILIGAMSAAIGAIITVAIRILFLGNNP
ncbi:MAG: shikimate dehydrogenase [Microcystis sp. M_OC_Ca_00000000_C217Col]|uniref:shikimate dehydrogenase n=1 Tax=Microcystis sp. M_OC_Ca_00000000_C217Col TaxID=2486213 RepID=UPI001192060A|nr:shikimate dehydrogenase [Microcystis sp. M_OC_Ca_00000000_C217Col]TRT89534.1 MAG: shikimate dehydrogenase [Microcystis sp. M_OC_Ca_00000000_C217Col]